MHNFLINKHALEKHRKIEFNYSAEQVFLKDKCNKYPEIKIGSRKCDNCEYHVKTKITSQIKLGLQPYVICSCIDF